MIISRLRVSVKSVLVLIYGYTFCWRRRHLFGNGHFLFRDGFRNLSHLKKNDSVLRICFVFLKNPQFYHNTKKHQEQEDVYKKQEICRTSTSAIQEPNRQYSAGKPFSIHCKQTKVTQDKHVVLYTFWNFSCTQFKSP